MKKNIFIYTISTFLALYSTLCFAFKSPSEEDIQFVKNCKLLTLEKETSIKQQYDAKINEYEQKMPELMRQMSILSRPLTFETITDSEEARLKNISFNALQEEAQRIQQRNVIAEAEEPMKQMKYAQLASDYVNIRDRLLPNAYKQKQQNLDRLKILIDTRNNHCEFLTIYFRTVEIYNKTISALEKTLDILKSNLFSDKEREFIHALIITYDKEIQIAASQKETWINMLRNIANNHLQDEKIKNSFSKILDCLSKNGISLSQAKNLFNILISKNKSPEVLESIMDIKQQYIENYLLIEEDYNREKAEVEKLNLKIAA